MQNRVLKGLPLDPDTEAFVRGHQPTFHIHELTLTLERGGGYAECARCGGLIPHNTRHRVVTINHMFRLYLCADPGPCLFRASVKSEVSG